MSQPQETSRQACALVHVKNWSEAQAVLAQSERQRTLMAGVFRPSIMDDELMIKIAALYSPEVWTTLTEQTLLDLVADLKSWQRREKHVLPLCDFLNSIVEEERTEHVVKMRVEAEARRPFPLLELPNDIRIRIYDVIVALMLPEQSGFRDRAYIQTHSDEMGIWSQELLVFPFTQVSKQIRLEFLPRWHRVVELNFDVTGTQYDPDLIDEWIEDFGPSRVPMTRSFAFGFGDDIVRLELRGSPSKTVFGHRLHHEGGNSRQPSDMSDVLKEKYRISSPDAWMPKRQKARALREADFALKFQRFVEPVLVESADGHVNLTVQGIHRIIEYLRQRAIPKPDMEPFEEDLMDEEDCLMM